MFSDKESIMKMLGGKVIETIISKLEVITTDQRKKLRFCG